MSLNLNISQSFTTPVVIQLPAADAIRFEIEFKRMTGKQLDELLKNASETDATILDLVNDLVVGWNGFSDKDNQTIPFNSDNLRDLLDLAPNVGQALLDRYLEASKAQVSKN